MLSWRKMMDKMNTENFKILVDALEALPEDIKNNEVAMNSALKPNPFCGTAGCFAGLISIVNNNIVMNQCFFSTLSPRLVINISISAFIVSPNRWIFPRPHLD
jgi:hypothetical protein